MHSMLDVDFKLAIHLKPPIMRAMPTGSSESSELSKLKESE
jgi:hypothetical protein